MRLLSGGAGFLRGCIAGLVLGGLMGVPRPAGAETTDRIIAFVNDEIITEGDVKAQMSALLEQADHQVPDRTKAQELRQAVIQHLIEERLIVQEARRMGLAVSSEEVQDRLRAIQQRSGTPEVYAKMLREANLTEEQLKKKLREQLLAQKAVTQEIRAKISISPLELSRARTASPQPAEAGEELRAYHVLVRVSDNRTPEEAQALAAHLQEQLLNGADVNTQASRDAKTPGVEGSVIGWVHRGQLLPEIDQVLFGLKEGGVSPPIQTHLGSHVVKVIERRRISAADVAAVDERLQQQLYQAKFLKAMEEWLQSLRRHAYIRVVDGAPEASGG